MWFIHTCLANLTVNCMPRNNAELGEYIGAVFAAFFAIAGFFVALALFGEWLG